VNLSRHLKVDAEGALRKTIDKFAGRFAHVEARVKAEHGGFGGATGNAANLPLEVLDGYWEEAKAAARDPKGGKASSEAGAEIPGPTLGGKNQLIC
jgi:uncharacterized protein YabN with tetrapyrrole methylase and pyrophosphatase domain